MTSRARTGGNPASLIDLARNAVAEGHASSESAGLGQHLATQEDTSGLTVVEFESTLPAYPGWRWTVVLAHGAAGGPTVCDVVLLPGDGALVAPRWVPWRDRVLPGDLGPGDILPTDPDDARLMPGYAATDGDEDVLDAVWELGLGRERVMTLHGREVTADRWYTGSTGPSSADARLAPNPCASCGFFIGLKGALHAEFGVCANEFSPADGRVVSIAFGCGAHSGIVESATRETSAATLDEFEYQPLDIRTAQTHKEATDQAAEFELDEDTSRQAPDNADAYVTGVTQPPSSGAMEASPEARIATHAPDGESGGHIEQEKVQTAAPSAGGTLS